MIWTVLQIHTRRLVHNRIELLLTFVVPIAFFSVFALIFGKGIGGGSTPKVKVVLADEVQSELSNSVTESLRKNSGLRFMESESESELTRDQASEIVRSGRATVGIVVTQDEDQSISADLLADSSDQVAPQVLSAIVGRELIVLQAQAAEAARGRVGEAEARTAAARGETTVRRPSLEDDVAPLPKPEPELEDQAFAGVRIVDVLGEGKSNPVVSMYAAGIAVMFLLFGASGGGGALLEERENTTLDRLLSTRLSMDQLLIGKWFYLSVIGFLQVCVMFIWGALVFEIDLLGHIDGFVMMTLVTSGAAAAFGLFLATLCKTRGQLNGLSVILILTMSALGGSMVPRYVMSQGMRDLGQWTFNAWALDGYDKVFWRNMPVESLSAELGVLMAAGVAFLLVARALAVRWESD
ncbi:MAG: ABC transporter permease [Planctomycetota bacterium]